MKKSFWMLIGGIIFTFALLADLLIIGAMMVVLYGAPKSPILCIGIVFGSLWFFFHSQCKPFSCWKPSNMKAFWRNWKQICE